MDGYIAEELMQADTVLEAVLRACTEAGLPAINVTPPQGKLLHLLAKMRNASRILEIGTLGGYSTIWLARALPNNGCLVTLELEPKHAEVARANFSQAGVAGKIDLRIGLASDHLAQLVAARVEPFDLVFIDADKASAADYFGLALKLSHLGTAIIVDNVIRQGAVADSTSTDLNVRGIQRFNRAVAAESRVTATAIQTVGSKGYDGFALVLVTGS